MEAFEKEHGVTRQQMARLCKCSYSLLDLIIEGNQITVPQIAAWIARKYGLTVEEYNDLVPEKYMTDVLPEPPEPPKDMPYSWHGIYKKLILEGENED